MYYLRVQGSRFKVQGSRFKEKILRKRQATGE
jgi:hypothetical protein